MTEQTEDSALRLEWQDQEAQNGAAMGAGKDSEQTDTPVELQEGAAPQTPWFLPIGTDSGFQNIG